MELKSIQIKKIKPNYLQPRKKFDNEKLEELARSIKEVGILQPILVRKSGKNFEIISGERRWRAAKLTGLKTIACIIKKIKNGELVAESLIENIHRKDLSDIEKAKAMKIIMKREKIKSKSELARRLGLSQGHITSIFDSADIRSELSGPDKNVSYSVISETAGLSKDERKKVIRKASKEDIGGRKVREFVSIYKKVPKPIKKQMLAGKIKPERAKDFVIDETLKLEIIEDIRVGEFKCPKCNKKLRVIHREPKGHFIKEA